jgi:2-oxoglutarate dehydrogenase E2 component (dihydrolipoamide succinyltransferase)
VPVAAPQAPGEGTVELDAAVAELYGGPPAAFVAERTALVRALRAEGRRDEAATVKSLRKPKTVAWALDAGALASPGAVAGLAGAVDEVGEAQAGGGDVRAALARLRDAESALVDAAGDAARAHDHAVERSVLAAAVRALVGDPGALAQLRAVRLVDVPTSGGLGVVLPAGAPAPAAPEPAPEPTAEPTATAAPPRAPSRAGARRRPRDDEAPAPAAPPAPAGPSRATARAAVAAAERAARAATRAAGRAASGADAAEAQLRRAEDEADAARRRADEAREAAQRARRVAAELAAEQDEADAALASARDALRSLDT